MIVDRAVGPRLRPGDITLPRWQGVSPLYVDITISHPAAEDAEEDLTYFEQKLQLTLQRQVARI